MTSSSQVAAPAPTRADIEAWYDAFLATLGAGPEPEAIARRFVKPGYRIRTSPRYFEDAIEGITHQPDVYVLASLAARRLGAQRLVDVGCGRGRKLLDAASDLDTVGIDFGANIESCRRAHPDRRWLACDLDRAHALPLTPTDLEDAVLVCSDVIEHLVEPEHLLASLRAALAHARLLVLSTPERDLARGIRDQGPPANEAHAREWTLAEFARLLEHHGLPPARIGLTRSDDRSDGTRTILALVSGRASRPGPPRPRPRHAALSRLLTGLSRFAGGRSRDPFREVVAIMTAYNEGDVIAYAIRRLVDQGIGVYLIDNWSTDNTIAQARLFEGRGLIGHERFPSDGPPRYYEWRRLLRRVEALHRTLGARWYIHHDADEVREAPWPETSLREGLLRVEREGFTCVNHVVLVFRPVDDGFVPGTDMAEYFAYYELGRRPAHAVQMKAWRNLGGTIDLAASGGHSVEFTGKQVHPIPFLLRHYPIRGQTHGVRKVLRERLGRFDPEERRAGWHTQYDRITEDHSFLADPATLTRYDAAAVKGALLAGTAVPSRTPAGPDA